MLEDFQTFQKMTVFFYKRPWSWVLEFLFGWEGEV